MLAELAATHISPVSVSPHAVACIQITGADLLCCLLLLIIVVVDAAAVLGAPVTPLLVEGGGVHMLEEAI